MAKNIITCEQMEAKLDTDQVRIVIVDADMWPQDITFGMAKVLLENSAMPAPVLAIIMQHYLNQKGLEPKRPWARDRSKCDQCENPAMHHGGRDSLCCRCHIDIGGIPANWHDLCMSYSQSREKGSKS